VSTLSFFFLTFLCIVDAERTGTGSSRTTAGTRREENSISFRHFLQNSSESNPSRSRHPLGMNGCPRSFQYFQ